MPFKSEKQRRYLWANEPEIARDWTETYGSKIKKAQGGRIGYYSGGQSIPSEYTVEDARKTAMQDKLGGITDIMKKADLYRQGDVGQMYMADGGKISIQGGVKNYEPSQMINAPIRAKSSPDHPTAHLAYITPEEQDILIDLNLYGSLKGKPNRGPAGLPSLQGDFGKGGKDFGGFRGGADIQSAETGNFGGFTGRSPQLPPGVDPKPSQDALDIRSGAIASGAGQRVNPGFFGSRNRVGRNELLAARQFSPQAYRATRGGLNPMGIMGLLGKYMKQPFTIAATGFNSLRDALGGGINTLKNRFGSMYDSGRNMLGFGNYFDTLSEEEKRRIANLQMIDGELVDTRDVEDTFGESDPILQNTSFQPQNLYVPKKIHSSPEYLNEFFIDVNELLSK